MVGTVAVVETQEPPTEDDAFEAAFDQLSAANDAAKTGDTPPPAPAPEVVPAPEGDLQPGEVLAPTGGTAPPTPTGGTAPPAPTGGAGRLQPMSDDEIARIAAIAAQMQPRQQVQQQRQEPQPDPTALTDQEAEFINNYMTEYPDITRAEAMLRRQDILQSVRYIFGEVSKVVEPIRAMVQELSARTHLGDLQRLVPDQPLSREEAITWAQQQPDFLQPGYFQVIQRGTAEQVAAMTKMVRASQGAVIPAAAAGGSAAAAVQRQAFPVAETPQAKRALAALAPVQAKRSGVSSDALEPADFDAAFDRFASMADALKK